jgi:NitT/TauT family transport system permease protein
MGLRSASGRWSGIVPGLGIPLLLLLWWILATGGRSDSIFPRPGEVAGVLVHPFTDLMSAGSLAWNTSVSLVRICLGFLLAVLVGIPAGLVMGASRRARSLLTPTVEMARPLSAIALIPLSIMLFKSRTLSVVLGMGHLRYQRHMLNEIQLGMLFILFWGGVFPIILDTMQGVRSVRRLHIEAATVLGARRSFIFRHVLLPSALPDIFHGLRMSIGRCWMVIVAAEMLPGTNSGIGYMISYSYQLSRYDVMLACLVIVGVIGALFSKGLEALGERSLVLRSRER